MLPVGHRHGYAPLCLVLGIIEIHGGDAVEGFEFFLGEVVFSHYDIGLEDFALWGVAPCGEAHLFFGAIRSIYNQLGGRMAVNGEVQLVLNCCEENLR